MATPIASGSDVTREESFRNMIDIVPIPEELRALRDRADITKAERATLHAMIRIIKAVDTRLLNHMRDEKQARIKIEHQLALIQESHRQDGENFEKLKDFMTRQFGYRL
ncbi:hypothetical protein Tco_0005477 [Tanacetum coccineum]